MTTKAFYLGDSYIDPDLLRVSIIDFDPVVVEPKVMDVLLRLVRDAEVVVSRDQLMSDVWPDVIIVDDTLTRCISQLRKVLGDSAVEPKIIETIRKRGYRVMVQPSFTAPGVPGVVDVVYNRKTRQSNLAIGVSLVIPIIFVIGWFLGKSTPIEGASSANDAPQSAIFMDSTQSITQLPLQNSSFVLIGEPVSVLESSLMFSNSDSSSDFVWQSEAGKENLGTN